MKPRLLSQSLVIALALLLPFQPYAQSSKPVVQTSVISEQMLAPTRVLQGTVIAASQASLAAQRAGRVHYVAELGSQIQAGAVVARLDDSQAKLAIAREQARLSRLNAELALAERQTARFQSLSQAIAPAQRDEAVARVQVLSAEVSEAKVALQMAQLELAETTIRAPFRGQVSSKFKQLGEYANPGEALVELTQADQPKLSVAVPIELARWSKPGSKLSLGKDLYASLYALVPGPAQSRQMQARLRLPNDFDATIGGVVEIRWPSAQAELALTVPEDAVVQRREGNHLMRITSGRAQRVPVQLGERSAGRVAVLGALHAGDQIVVRGAETLSEGAEVLVQATDAIAKR